MRLGRGHACRILNYTKDGQPLWNQLSIVPVRAQVGAATEVTHYVGMQTFTPAHAPPAPPTGGASLAASNRNRSFMTLPVQRDEPAASALPRSSSNAVLSAYGTHGLSGLAGLPL